MKFFIAWLCLAAWAAPLSAQTPVPLKILCEIDRPNQYLGPDGRLAGFSVEVVQALQKRVGNTDIITVSNWSNAYETALSQPNVLLFTTNRTKARDKKFQWVGPLMETEMGLYSLKIYGRKVRSLQDAKNLPSIGVYKDDVKDQFLTASGFKNLDRAPNSQANTKKLAAGYVSAMASSPIAIHDDLVQAGIPPEDVELLYVFMKTQAYLAFSVGTPAEVVQAWSRALEGLKADGSFAALYRRHYPGRSLPGPAVAPQF